MTITSNNRDGKQNICKKYNKEKYFQGSVNTTYPLGSSNLKLSKLRASFPSVFEGFIQVLTERRDRLSVQT